MKTQIEQKIGKRIPKQTDNTMCTRKFGPLISNPPANLFRINPMLMIIKVTFLKMCAISIREYFPSRIPTTKSPTPKQNPIREIASPNPVDKRIAVSISTSKRVIHLQCTILILLMRSK